MRTRAERRHHHKRMLEKVKSFSIYNYFFWTEDKKTRHQKKIAETRKPCSCWMCGNPRRFFKDKMTMQEKRQEHIKHDDD
jgi:hypothetical protein